MSSYLVAGGFILMGLGLFVVLLALLLNERKTIKRLYNTPPWERNKDND